MASPRRGPGPPGRAFGATAGSRRPLLIILDISCPNGSYDPATTTLLAREPISMAFTMRPAPLRASRPQGTPLEIPRVGLGTLDGFDLLRLTVAGAALAARPVHAGLRRLRRR